MSNYSIDALKAELNGPKADDSQTFEAPSAALEIEGFVATQGETVMTPRVFSSGKPGWRMDVSGTLHGVPVRLQLNATIRGLKK